MDRNRVTVRYARALVELAVEQEVLDNIEHDSKVLFSVLKSYDNLLESIISPGLNVSEKRKKIHSLFSSEFHGLTLKFIDLVLSHHRQEYLIDICRNCIEMIREMKGIVTAELETAFELDNELETKVKSEFEKKTNKTINLTTRIDPGLIGGFIFTIDGEQFDASIASKLSSLKKQLQIK